MLIVLRETYEGTVVSPNPHPMASAYRSDVNPLIRLTLMNWLPDPELTNGLRRRTNTKDISKLTKTRISLVHLQGRESAYK